MGEDKERVYSLEPRTKELMTKSAWLLSPFGCAILFCLANVFKPAVIDDVAYIWFVPPILENPAEPFGPPPDGFHMIWYDRGEGAFTLLTPMVLPYWLAIGARIFGESLIALKLWLFPFCWLLTWSLASLLRRFAPRHEKPLLVMTIFSPAMLPSLNVMVDVPALALGLSSVVVFLREVECPTVRWRWLIASGLLAGLAAQTKYTGASYIAIIAWCAVRNRRWAAGIVAAGIAVTVFVAWEAYLTGVYGRSHFLLQTQRRQIVPEGGIIEAIARKASLVVPIGGMLGGLTPALSLMLLAALRCRRHTLIGLGALQTALFLLVMFLPDSLAVFMRNPRQVRDEVSLSTIWSGANAFLFIFAILVSISYLAFRGWSRLRVRWRGNPDDVILLGWLAIELAATFALSPFVAARRVMGIIVVCTLLGGRLLSRTGRSRERQRLVNLIALYGLLLSVIFLITDYVDAFAEKHAMQDSLAWIRSQPEADRPVWFTGHWGFHYYGREAGLHPIIPNESDLQEGDWIIYPDTLLRPYGQIIKLGPPWAERQVRIDWYECWPLRTVPDFYDGYQPIRHHEGQRMRINIFRVKKAFRAEPT